MVFTAAALSFSIHVESIVTAVFVFVFLCLLALLRDTEVILVSSAFVLIYLQL